MKKFWREKNADYYIGKEEVTIPNKQELTDSIINKFEEKLLMIDVIFDESARNKYLKEKNKTIPEGTPLIKIQQKIGTRVVVDFLQLIKDYSLLKEIDLKLEFNKNDKIFNKEEITKGLRKSINELRNDVEEGLHYIFKDINNLIILLDLKYDELENERKVIEEKEGNFYKGKFVVFK
jgi:hypothetical protein